MDFRAGLVRAGSKFEGRKRYGVISDHLDTPTMLLTETGQLAWKAQLDVWGVLQEEAGAVREENRTCNPWRRPGQYEDAETGLYYNRFRYYDPETGRYISQDPIGLDGGLPQYGYVHDPLRWIDPLGLRGCGPKKRSYPRDYATPDTKNLSGSHASERDARAFAKRKLGRNSVEIEPGKLRSQDGHWQCRAKQIDLAGHGPNDTPHVHLEQLDPSTGEVLINWHLRW